MTAVAAIETNAGGGIGGGMTMIRTALQTVLEFTRKRICIARNDRARPSEWRHCKRTGLF